MEQGGTIDALLVAPDGTYRVSLNCPFLPCSNNHNAFIFVVPLSVSGTSYIISNSDAQMSLTMVSIRKRMD